MSRFEQVTINSHYWNGPDSGGDLEGVATHRWLLALSEITWLPGLVDCPAVALLAKFSIIKKLSWQHSVVTQRDRRTNNSSRSRDYRNGDSCCGSEGMEAQKCVRHVAGSSDRPTLTLISRCCRSRGNMPQTSLYCGHMPPFWPSVWLIVFRFFRVMSKARDAR